MLVHAIAFLLPDGKTYFTSHAHVDQKKCVWNRVDREVYHSLLGLVKRLYLYPESGKDLKEQEILRYKPKGMSMEEALQRVVPYYVTADRVTKDTTILEENRDSVSRVREAGINVEHGLDFYVIVKQDITLKPTWELINRTFSRISNVKARNQKGELLPRESWAPGMAIYLDGTKLDLDSQEFRKFLPLVQAVRRGGDLVTSGKLKVVAVPNDKEVNLLTNSEGEFLQERAAVWS